MTDDEIIEAVDRRFAEVEDRLPPRALGSAGGVDPVRRERVAARIASEMQVRLAMVAIVVVALVGFSVLGRLGGQAPSVAERSPDTLTQSPTATAAPSTNPRSSASAPYETSFVDGLEVLRGESDASELISIRLGWSGIGRCFMTADILRQTPDFAAIDAAAEAADLDEGWLDMPGKGRVLIGPSLERSALTIGATILAIGGRGDTAIFLNDAVHDFGGSRTPAGRTVWMTNGTTKPIECPPGD
jgi:hypothetical protein